ncbi:hypothetical protein MESS4_50042 [Mesorhizobium sp. STM 4661]|nr:hypothetical protein MESS4_50042 [Mesorhizobium sp. STM 4661]
MKILSTDQPQEAFDERAGKGLAILVDGRAKRCVRHFVSSISGLVLNGGFLLSVTLTSGSLTQPTSGLATPIPRKCCPCGRP